MGKRRVIVRTPPPNVVADKVEIKVIKNLAKEGNSGQKTMFPKETLSEKLFITLDDARLYALVRGREIDDERTFTCQEKKLTMVECDSMRIHSKPPWKVSSDEAMALMERTSKAQKVLIDYLINIDGGE